MRRPIHLILHPHDETGGWRWGVYLDTDDPTALDRCINAGHGDTLEVADADGQLVAYSVLTTLALLSMPAEIVPHELDVDPLVGVTTPNLLLHL